MNIVRPAALAAAFLGAALGAPTLSASAQVQTAFPITTVTSVTAATIARAKATYQQVADGRIDRGALTPSLNNDITDDVAAVLTQKATSLGTYDKFTVAGQTDTDGITTTVFRLHFPDGYLDYNFGVDDATGKIAKLYFVPGPSQDTTQ